MPSTWLARIFRRMSSKRGGPRKRQSVVAVPAYRMLFEYGHLEHGERVLNHGAAGAVGSTRSPMHSVRGAPSVRRTGIPVHRIRAAHVLLEQLMRRSVAQSLPWSRADH